MYERLREAWDTQSETEEKKDSIPFAKAMIKVTKDFEVMMNTNKQESVLLLQVCPRRHAAV
jgi:hypothetical protein